MLGVTSCWKNYEFHNPGWYRVATITGSSGNSSDISIKREYNIRNNECHKVQLISVYKNAEFKSVYDSSNEQLLKKIRYVSAGTNAYIDVFYDCAEGNGLTISIADNINCASTSWKMLATQVVSETTDGETVLATMDFGENTWLGQPL